MHSRNTNYTTLIDYIIHLSHFFRLIKDTGKIFLVKYIITWGNVPWTRVGMSSFLKPSSVKPFSIFIMRIYSFTVSARIFPASVRLAFLTFAPSNSAASRCLSGHAFPVKEKTAGAEITTDRPWGTMGWSLLYPLNKIAVNTFKPEKYQKVSRSNNVKYRNNCISIEI